MTSAHILSLCMCALLQDPTPDVPPDLRLHQAALAGDVVRVDSLLDVGVLARAVDGEGRTALFFAAAQGHTEVIASLVNYGVPLNITDHLGWTPLMGAAYFGQSESAQMLLDFGADPEIETAGTTAVVLAEEQGHTATVELLRRVMSTIRVMGVEPRPDRVYVLAEIDTRPELVRPPRTSYPSDLRGAGVEGECWVTFIIDTDGEVEADSYRTILCTHPGFVPATRRAFLRTEYEPGRINDTPVRVRVEQWLQWSVAGIDSAA